MVGGPGVSDPLDCTQGWAGQSTPWPRPPARLLFLLLSEPMGSESEQAPEPPKAGLGGTQPTRI